MNSKILKIGCESTKIYMWLKRYQRIKLDHHIVKVNIGSGLRVANGWVNVDSNPHILLSKMPLFCRNILYRLLHIDGRGDIVFIKHLFILHNLEYGLPFRDESVDYLYSSHSLEHLYRDDAATLLGEAFRVLKNGGIIRICLPDLEYAISLYQKGDKLKALEFFFNTSNNEYL